MRSSLRFALSALLGFVLAIACFGSLSDEARANGPQPATPDAGGSAARVATADLSPRCPPTAPNKGATCADDGLQCEYGSDARPCCNTVATCSQARWQITPDPVSGPDCGCPTPPNSSACSTSKPSAATGTPCPLDGLVCRYAEGDCVCRVPCRTVGPMQVCEGSPLWACPTLSPACPIPRPRYGVPCTVTGTQCDYFAARECGTIIICADGTWRAGMVACPQ